MALVEKLMSCVAANFGDCKPEEQEISALHNKEAAQKVF